MLGLRPVYSDATQLDVELNCVAINGPLQSTGKELTIGLVGAGHAADRGIIDYRDNSDFYQGANISVQLIRNIFIK